MYNKSKNKKINIKIYRIIRDFLILKPQQINELLNLWGIDDNSLKKRFLNKYNNFISVNKKNINIISLGQNCLPHSASIWNGFKLPNYLTNSQRAFFDLGITNIQHVNEILYNNKYKTLEICDKVIKNGNKYYFGSEKYNFLFNHDCFTIQNNIIDLTQLELFNKTLRKRLYSFTKMIQEGNNILILNITKYEKQNIIDNFFSFIKDYNPSNIIYVINHTDYDYRFKDAIVKKIKKPSDNFVWFNDLDTWTSEGEEYENLIFEPVRNLIIDSPPLKNIHQCLFNDIDCIIDSVKKSRFYLRCLLLICILNEDIELLHNIEIEDPSFSFINKDILIFIKEEYCNSQITKIINNKFSK